MLSLGGFPPPCNTTHHHTISQFLPFPSKTHQTHLAFLSDGLTHFNFCPVLHQIPTKFCVSALKGRSGGSGDNNRLLEIEDFDEDFDDEDEDEDGDDDEEDEEMFVPLMNMKKWIENKPSGFGEGKLYDTSIEDNLLEEMLQSREAQLANINKLKNSPENPNSKKEITQKQRAPEVVPPPSGFRVRLVNLPKKKNIQRDLQLAFKGVPGVVNIAPAVSGNKKTRDPICKGFAFVDLKSEEDANRFVKTFSRQSISFGKIQKQIKCEIMYSKSPTSAYEQSSDRSYSAPQLVFRSLGEGSDADFDIDGTSPDSWEVAASDESKAADDEFVQAQWEDDGENLGSFSSSDDNAVDSMEARTESASDALISKKQAKVRRNEKKLVAKRKGTKDPKLNIPGSANRLKIKEKALLTGVLSKYAVQASSASKEQS